MSTLSNELRGVIGRHVEQADSRQILAIASALCTDAGAPIINAAGSAQEERFEIVGADRDMVLDRQTGLMWARDSIDEKRFSWSDAKAACENIDLGGYADWRMPSIRELLTLVDYDRYEPAIDPVFNCESAFYWTATPWARSPGDYAWGVGFSGGAAVWDAHDSEGFVRAVRPGQS